MDSVCRDADDEIINEEEEEEEEENIAGEEEGDEQDNTINSDDVEHGDPPEIDDYAQFVRDWRELQFVNVNGIRRDGSVEEFNINVQTDEITLGHVDEADGLLTIGEAALLRVTATDDPGREFFRLIRSGEVELELANEESGFFSRLGNWISGNIVADFLTGLVSFDYSWGE